MRLILATLTFIFIAGCTNKLAETNLNPTQLDLPKYVQELVKNMSDKHLKISKTFILNNKSETKIYTKSDSSFWRKELAMLEQLDLNSPQLSGTFEIEKGSKDQFSNLLIDKYSFTVKDGIGIKELLIYYLDDPADIRQIKAEITTKNLISKSNSQLSIWVNRYGEDLLVDSLEVISQDKTLMQPARNYRSITTVQR